MFSETASGIFIVTAMDFSLLKSARKWVRAASALVYFLNNVNICVLFHFQFVSFLTLLPQKTLK